MTMAGFDHANKGIPFAHRDATGWNLFGDDATFPAAVLLESALKGNSASMSDYCLRNGVSLAPHGKTTMSPELFALQLRDGAWAITAANVHQARVMRDSGVPRVLIANEVTAPGDIAWLATQVDAGFPIVLLRRLGRRGASASGGARPARRHRSPWRADRARRGRRPHRGEVHGGGFAWSLGRRPPRRRYASRVRRASRGSSARSGA